MLASFELKKRENRDDIEFLQMKVYLSCGIYSMNPGRFALNPVSRFVPGRFAPIPFRPHLLIVL